MGKPFVYKTETPKHDTDGTGTISIKKEIEGYKEALEQSRRELDKIFNLAKEKLDAKNLKIFEAQLSFLDDKIFHDSVISRVKNEKRAAHSVFNDEISKIHDQLLSSNDEYIRERVNDIEDIKNRVLRNIAKGKLISKIQENCIVIARNLTPADTILFSNRKLLGFATDMGGANSHVALIARSLNLPAVVGLNDISLQVTQSDFVIVDGYKGVVIKNPSVETIEDYKRQVRKYHVLEKNLLELEKLPTRTLDGADINLKVNLEFNKELDYVISHAGCDVGLYRTEHMFLELQEFPSEEKQYKQYSTLAERLYPKEIVIRTFDIGGDKLLPDTQREQNPFLGWRGIRVCLDKQEIFMAQLRAILRASRKGNVRIMLPMIASVEEVTRTKALIEIAKAELKKKRMGFNEKISVGIMVEVPSAVFIADSLAKEVDFFSIGTNDLVQYILAVDRDSSIISELYQKFHPAVLQALSMIVKSSEKNNIELSVCGEMAGDPLGAILLIGMGVKVLSVETTSFLKIKRLIRSMKFQDAQRLSNSAMKLGSAAEIRNSLVEYYNKIVGND